MRDLLGAAPFSLKPLLGAPLDRGHPLAAGLSGAWLLNENAGGRLADLAGSRPATCVGAPTWQAGVSGPALGLSGTGQYAKIAVTPLLSSSVGSLVFTGTLTSNSGVSTIMSVSDESGHVALRLAVNSGGDLLVVTPSNAALQTAFAQSPFGTVPTRAQIVLTGDNSAFKLYANGRLLTFGAGTNDGNFCATGTLTGTKTMTLFARDNFGTYQDAWVGTAEYLWLYNRALSAGEVSALYADPYAMFRRGSWLDAYARGGAAWTLSVSDALALSDARAFALTKPLSDTLGLTDSRVLAVGKNAAESLGLSDARVLALGKNAGETLALTDARSLSVGKNAQDTLALVDARILDLGKNAAETLTLSDAVAKSLTKPFSDTLSLSDSRALALTKAWAETLSLSDSADLLVALVLAVSDTLALTDSHTFAIGKNALETLALTDTMRLDLSKRLAETLALSDDRTFAIGKVCHEILSLSDAALWTLAEAILLLLSRVTASGDPATAGGSDDPATEEGGLA